MTTERWPYQTVNGPSEAPPRRLTIRTVVTTANGHATVEYQNARPIHFFEDGTLWIVHDRTGRAIQSFPVEEVERVEQVFAWGEVPA